MVLNITTINAGTVEETSGKSHENAVFLEGPSNPRQDQEPSKDNADETKNNPSAMDSQLNRTVSMPTDSVTMVTQVPSSPNTTSSSPSPPTPSTLSHARHNSIITSTADIDKPDGVTVAEDVTKTVRRETTISRRLATTTTASTRGTQSTKSRTSAKGNHAVFDPEGATTAVSGTLFTTENSTSLLGAGTPPPSDDSLKTVAIVVPIVLGLLLVAAIVGIVLLVFRAKRRHRKNNIMKYKRYSQNGEITFPLTSISNENYRSSGVSAHEDAIVYARVEKTKRPPRPTYKYKSVTEVDLPSNQSALMWNTFPRKNKSCGDDLDTVLIDNATYESSPLRKDQEKPPKRAVSSGSLKRTPGTPRRVPGSPRKDQRVPSSPGKQSTASRVPGSPKRQISWPIPQQDASGSPIVPRASQGPCNDLSPPVPPSAQYGPPALRPAAPSPGPPRFATRPVPPTPLSVSEERLPNGHDYDPVYIPSSDADAMSRKLDDAGYVTSRRMRMNALRGRGLEAYEDVQAVTATTITPSPQQQLRAQTSTDARLSESDHVDGAHNTSSHSGGGVGDRSFDTVDTEDNNNVNFSLEDICKVCDGLDDPVPDDADVEYYDIPDTDAYNTPIDAIIPNGHDPTHTVNVSNKLHHTDTDDDERDSAYETVDFT